MKELIKKLFLKSKEKNNIHEGVSIEELLEQTYEKEVAMFSRHIKYDFYNDKANFN